MKLLIVSILLMFGCVHAKVTRIGRHERFIQVSSKIGTPERMVKLLVHKSKRLGCDSLHSIRGNVQEHYIEAVCVTTP